MRFMSLSLECQMRNKECSTQVHLLGGRCGGRLAIGRMNRKRRPATVFDYNYSDIEMLDYQHHAKTRGAVAV